MKPAVSFYMERKKLYSGRNLLFPISFFAGVIIITAATQKPSLPEMRYVYDWTKDDAKKVPIRIRGQDAGYMECKKVESFIQLSIHRKKENNGKVSTVYSGGLLPWTQIGFVDLRNDGTDEIVVVSTNEGTSYREKDLRLIIPSTGDSISLGFSDTKSYMDIVSNREHYKGVYKGPYNREWEYLERLKYEFGYISKGMVMRDKENPKYAFYLWKEEPGEIRRYKGNYWQRDENTIAKKVQDGDITYFSKFKGGIFAYDRGTQEEYVLYHPKDNYNWSKDLLCENPYLVFKGDEGTHVLDTGTMKTKIIKDDYVVSKIENHQLVLHDYMNASKVKKIDLDLLFHKQLDARK